jgi:hypothetical protein
MTAEGSCPDCGDRPSLPNAHGKITADNLNLRELAGMTEAEAKAPWHFKMLLGALVLYLTWRVISLFS